MKPIVLVFGLVLTSCSSIDHIVDSDYSYQGNFNKYRTFDFASKTYLPGADDEKVIVEKYIKSKLRAWGYSHHGRKPDLLVFYAVYYNDLRLHGFDQPEFQTWVRSNFRQELVFKKDTLLDQEFYANEPDKNRTPEEDYDKVLYNLREGTILITLFDRKKRRTVWQGYASGVFGEDEDQNDRVMKSAIIKIMDEYRLLAFGAS